MSSWLPYMSEEEDRQRVYADCIPSHFQWQRFEETPADQDETRPNIGSFGHPDVCAKPCVYLMHGPCRRGAFCGYCHLDHKEPPARLSKQHRQYLEGLSAEDVVDMILPHLRNRVTSLGIIYEAADLVGLLQTTRSRLSRRVPDVQDQSVSASQMHQALRRLSITGLVGLILKRNDVEPAFMEDLELCFARFRSRVATCGRRAQVASTQAAGTGMRMVPVFL
ncbi:unnamed protein product [Effrenium voratum]|nr:unnamed protein product [Effrenium voratum]